MAPEFQLKNTKPLSPLGPGLWHPASPVMPNRGFSLLFCFLITFLLKVGWVWSRYWEACVCILYIFLSIPSVHRLDYTCTSYKADCLGPRSGSQPWCPACLPSIYTLHSACCLSAAFPETPTCCDGGMVRLSPPTPCSASLSHPPSCPLSSCVASIWLSLKARER